MKNLLRLLLTALLLVSVPITVSRPIDGQWLIGVDLAYASSDDDDDEDSDDSDDDDDDDSDDDEDSDDGDEDDDEDSDDEDDEDDDEYDDESNTPNATTDRQSNERSNGIENLHLRYPNGWDEKIRNERYILIDPEGRVVTNRPATFDDLDRMRDAAGL